MRKIPTVFLRDPDDMRRVTREIHPDCQWVFDGEGYPTRKLDGTCFMYDGDRWWARREVRPGKQPPPNYQPIETDQNTGKTVGWEPAEQSAYFKYFQEALKVPRRPGTYELIGPKVNGNPEREKTHRLAQHGSEIFFDFERTYDGIRAAVLAHHQSGVEGIVFHHPDGRMAKVKARDFPASTTDAHIEAARARKAQLQLPEGVAS